MSNADVSKISKFLSLVLRHQPETEGIALDENGCAEVSSLLKEMTDRGCNIDFNLLKEVVIQTTKNDLRQIKMELK